MTEYNNIKDLIIYYDPLIKSISIDQLITEIKKSVEEQKHFEDIIYSILENEDMSKKISLQYLIYQELMHLKFI